MAEDEAEKNRLPNYQAPVCHTGRENPLTCDPFLCPPLPCRQAALTRPEELPHEVVNIQAAQVCAGDSTVKLFPFLIFNNFELQRPYLLLSNQYVYSPHSDKQVRN